MPSVTYLSAVLLWNTYYCGGFPPGKVTSQKGVLTISNAKTQPFLEDGLILKPQPRSRLCYVLNL